MFKALSVGLASLLTSYALLARFGFYGWLGQVTPPSISTPSEWTITGLFAMVLWHLLGRMTNSMDKLVATQQSTVDAQQKHTEVMSELKNTIEKHFGSP